MARKPALKRIQKRRLAGVNLVMIPASHYAELLRYKELAEKMTVDQRSFSNERLSNIERRPEVAHYLAMRFGRMPMNRLLASCQRQFGKKATPSKSAAYRYWEKLRIKQQNPNPVFTCPDALGEYFNDVIAPQEE